MVEHSTADREVSGSIPDVPLSFPLIYWTFCYQNFHINISPISPHPAKTLIVQLFEECYLFLFLNRGEKGVLVFSTDPCQRAQCNICGPFNCVRNEV